MSKGFRAIAVLAGLAGIALIMIAAFQVWAYISVTGLPGGSDTPLAGRRAVPSAVPIALAAGAGVIVMATSGRVIRFLVAAALLVAGGGVALSSLNARQNAVDLAAQALQSITGVFGHNSLIATAGRLTGATAELTIWSWVGLAGGVLIAASGLIGLVTGAGWPGPATRFESGTAAPAGASAAGGQPGTSGPVDDAQAWDALTRGDDPT